VIVVDASAVTDFLLELGPRGEWVAERIGGQDALHVPHLLDFEVASAIRRVTLSGQATPALGRRALDDLREMPFVRYPAAGLLERVWTLRKSLSAYDASYVALAEALDAPLVTTDGRLARSSGHRAAIDSFSG